MESPYNGVTDFVIVLRNQEDPTRSQTIGIIGCDDSLEIGYALGRPYWGHGYMAEAMAILLCHFWSKDIKAITADVDPRNEASLKLLRSFGFQESGFEKNTHKTHIGWCDSVYFRLERPQVFVKNLASPPGRKGNQQNDGIFPTSTLMSPQLSTRLAPF
jgi:RimJ/RimL family protein N-acetyltransferase